MIPVEWKTAVAAFCCDTRASTEGGTEFCSRIVNVTGSNGRVRTRTHGCLAGVGATGNQFVLTHRFTGPSA
jgi:hypothetical protein